ncbi:hypothetical protein RRG08_040487 [Elysia crispata]|uniref:Major facilitator superfamily (MFS) profile domain-containing protein n=1 Tax=Elysia crispata TaxID=231223 RepID=A0AAE0Z527_9GAST|nr:hypothetical protein RRG08_040487 [Elysia crispata]
MRADDRALKSECVMSETRDSAMQRLEKVPSSRGMERTTGLEELINAAGGFGRFQFINLIIMLSGKFFCGWSMFQMTFAGLVPDFYCAGSAREDVLDFDSLPRNSTFNKCYVPFNTTNPYENKSECLIYNYTSPYKTIMKDFDLVCGRGWIKRALIVIQMAGLMVGCMTAGQMGDAIGRWWSNFIFVTVHCVGNLATAFSPGWEIFAACRFFIGVGIGGILVVAFIHVMEFLPKKWRPACASTPAWMVGVAVFALASYLLHDWRKLHFLCGACGLLQLPFLFFIPESVRWLVTQGRIDQAMTVIDKVARWNDRPPVQRARVVLENVYSEQKEAQTSEKKYTYVAIVRNWSVSKITLIMCYHWFCYSLAYYGISFGVSDLAGNFFVNVLLLGLIDTPCLLLSLYTNIKLGRKWTAVPLLVISLGCALTCMVLMITGEGGKASILITLLSLTAKSSVLVAWSVVQTWGNELYPTVIRNLGYGAANTTARVAGIFAPMIIDFKTRMTESYVLMGVLLLVDLVFVLLLPDTKNKFLPDTIVDFEIETVGKSGKFENNKESVIYKPKSKKFTDTIN